MNELTGRAPLKEGIHPILKGAALRPLLIAQAEYHSARAQWYRDRAEQLKHLLPPNATSQAGGYSSGVTDPLSEAVQAARTHANQARLLEFLAKYLDDAQEYLLGTNDLRLIGVLR